MGSSCTTDDENYKLSGRVDYLGDVDIVPNI